MTKVKVVNFILFLGLILLVMFWQSLEPLYVERETGRLSSFVYGWIIGIALGVAALAAGVAWARSMKTGKVRGAEAFFAALVAIAAFWVSVTLFREWLVLSRLR